MAEPRIDPNTLFYRPLELAPYQGWDDALAQLESVNGVDQEIKAAFVSSGRRGDLTLGQAKIALAFKAFLATCSKSQNEGNDVKALAYASNKHSVRELVYNVGLFEKQSGRFYNGKIDEGKISFSTSFCTRSVLADYAVAAKNIAERTKNLNRGFKKLEEPEKTKLQDEIAKIQYSSGGQSIPVWIFKDNAFTLNPALSN